ncbi:uncharacterized protein LOC115293482 [Suricata suricatta]|uniref:uncharacterized protein LOC115293482 n=1 Tax=Suricata suricatta TaxID=37032 RepID=UPI00115581FF|nr:uncharacterized protein LOC115293482 [Suricata suricatta]
MASALETPQEISRTWNPFQMDAGSRNRRSSPHLSENYWFPSSNNSAGPLDSHVHFPGRILPGYPRRRPSGSHSAVRTSPRPSLELVPFCGSKESPGAKPRRGRAADLPGPAGEEGKPLLEGSRSAWESHPGLGTHVNRGPRRPEAPPPPRPGTGCGTWLKVPQPATPAPGVPPAAALGRRRGGAPLCGWNRPTAGSRPPWGRHTGRRGGAGPALSPRPRSWSRSCEKARRIFDVMEAFESYLCNSQSTRPNMAPGFLQAEPAVLVISNCSTNYTVAN